MTFSEDDLRSAFPDHAIDFPHLGRGGSKIAYSASRDGQKVVLKVGLEPIASALMRAEGETIPGRLAREAQILASLDSPHIVAVTGGPDVVLIGNAHHVWFEEAHLPGGSLSERLGQRRLSTLESVETAVALTHAVELLWSSEEIVHRDIKPANILFSTADEPVLIDLGSALATQMSDITTPGNIAPTTFPYAPPELLNPRGQSDVLIDFRADMFSIAMVLAECCIGQHPVWRFGDTTWTYLDKLEALTADSLISQGADPALSVTIARALSIHPSRRYNSIQRFRDALERNI